MPLGAIDSDNGTRGESNVPNQWRIEKLRTGHYKPHARVPDDDIYSATPRSFEYLASHKKRKRETLTNETREKETHGANRDLDKRRKLLEQSDWVGIKVQKPMELKYTQPETSERVGKRRRLADNHRPLHITKSQSSYAFKPSATNNAFGSYRSRSGLPYGMLAPRSDVRISIGGKEVLPDKSLSSSVRKRQHDLAFEPSHRSGALFSDVMLLDNEVTVDSMALEDLGREVMASDCWMPLSSPARSINLRKTDDGVVFSSSSAELRCPVPASFHVASFLRASPFDGTKSGEAGSLGGGETLSTTTGNQFIQNKIQDTIPVVPQTKANSTKGNDYSDARRLATRKVESSPRISTAYVVTDDNGHLGDLEGQDFGNSSEPLQELEGSVPYTREPSPTLPQYPKAPDTLGVMSIWRMPPQEHKIPTNPTAARILAQPRHIQILKPQDSSQVAGLSNNKGTDNSDAAWKSFVLGSSSDALEPEVEGRSAFDTHSTSFRPADSALVASGALSYRLQLPSSSLSTKSIHTFRY